MTRVGSYCFFNASSICSAKSIF